MKDPGRVTMLVIGVFVGAIIYSAVCGYWKDYWLYHDSRQITATIFEKGAKPGTFHYEYNINGVRYTGEGQAGNGLGDHASIGGQALVYVASSRPWFSSVELPTFSPGKVVLVLAVLLSIEFYVLRDLVRAKNTSLPVLK